MRDKPCRIVSAAGNFACDLFRQNFRGFRLTTPDTNDADAQNDIGLIFLSASKHEEAIYWLKRSAQQENPDAMQGLGSCYLSGSGVPKDDYLGIMWISKAASYGHMIAKAQMAALWPGYVAIQK